MAERRCGCDPRVLRDPIPFGFEVLSVRASSVRSRVRALSAFIFESPRPDRNRTGDDPFDAAGGFGFERLRLSLDFLPVRIVDRGEVQDILPVYCYRVMARACRRDRGRPGGREEHRQKGCERIRDMGISGSVFRSTSRRWQALWRAALTGTGVPSSTERIHRRRSAVGSPSPGSIG